MSQLHRNGTTGKAKNLVRPKAQVAILRITRFALRKMLRRIEAGEDTGAAILGGIIDSAEAIVAPRKRQRIIDTCAVEDPTAKLKARFK